MAKPPPPLTQSQQPPQQEWEALGVQRSGTAFVLVALKMRGETLLSRKVLHGPDMRAVINDRFRIEAAKRCLS